MVTDSSGTNLSGTDFRNGHEREMAAIVGAAGTKVIDREPPDPREERSALVKRWTDRITRARAHWTQKAFAQMRRDMRFAAGHQWSDKTADDDHVDAPADRYVANVTLRHIQSRTAAIYGKNPRIVARRKTRLMGAVWDGSMASVQAAMAVLQTDPGHPDALALLAEARETVDRNRQTDRIARTLEVLFEHELDEQPVPFKVQMKATVRRGLTTGVGYVRLGYQRIMHNRPDVDAKIHDATMRLAALERIAADLADGETEPDSGEAEQLRLLLQALGQEDQVVVREGLTFSWPDSTAIIPDTNCRQLRGFTGCTWVAEEYFLTAERIREIWHVDVGAGGAGGAVSYREKEDGAFERCPDGTPDDREEYFCVWEAYNREDGLVYMLCDGYGDFLAEPAAPDVWLERFWPWFPFVVNEVCDDSSVFPPSDVSLMRDMQMELNRARQSLKEHRRAARPRTYVRNGVLQEDDKEALAACKAHDVIELNALEPNQDISDVLQAHAGVPLDPRLYDPSPAYEDYMRVLGQHEASLGGASKATATEVSVAEGARASSAASVVDDLDEFLTELARAGGQVLLMEAGADRVREVVGPGAVWPDLRRDEIAKEIWLDVEAASAGRPDQARQVQVAQQIFPMLMQIPGISTEWLARELLRRLDDKVDLTDAFAPNLPSVTMQNNAKQLSSPKAQGEGNAPAEQGAQGAGNAPDPTPAQVNDAPRPQAGQAQMPVY